MDQRKELDKIEPTLAAEPIENAEASEPTDPTDSIEPAEPMDKIEPDEPIERIDPLDPMLRMEPEDPGERDESAEICITTFWQAGDQPDISGLSAATWPHRARATQSRPARVGLSCPLKPSPGTAGLVVTAPCGGRSVGFSSPGGCGECSSAFIKSPPP